MLKLIQTEPYFSEGEPTVRILDLGSTNGLVKSAADSRIQEFTSKLTSEPNRTYVHILAMGASEYFGSNRNHDWFGEDALVEYHKTFETSPAHIFRNHINRNPAIAIGQIIFSVYNTRMRRVELVGWIDNHRGADVVERIEKGDFPPTSMATRTPYDVCSICGNRAHSRQDYCEHLTNELGRIYPDGRRVMAMNVAPLRFFDLSIVYKPADPTSSILQKVAFEEDGREIGSAELAEIEGLTEKTAHLKKLADFIKEIDGIAIDSSENLNDILDKVKDPEEDAIDILRHYKLNDIFSTMAELGISPTIGWLAELIARKTMGSNGIGLGQLVEGYVSEAGIEGLPIAEKDFGESTPPNMGVISALMPSVKQASLLPEYVSDRSVTYYGGNTYAEGTNVGYAGNGPKIEETPYEKFRRLNLEPNVKNPAGLAHVLKTLTIIGGAALAAKWFITNIIEKKMQEAEMQRHHNEVKISLVKSSSDYRSTYHIAKCAMIKLFQKKA